VPGVKVGCLQGSKKNVPLLLLQEKAIFSRMIFINGVMILRCSQCAHENSDDSSSCSSGGNLFSKHKTLTLPDGTKYAGALKDGLPEGKGSLTWSDGTKYAGALKNGLPNGQGMLTFPDGTKYIGSLKDGMPEGQGSLTSPDGIKYAGELKDGLPSGKGTVTWPVENNGVNVMGAAEQHRIGSLPRHS
jgi:hypothetical protein